MDPIWRQIKAMILPFAVILLIPGILISALPDWQLFNDGWWRYLGFLPLLAGMILFTWTVGLFAYEGKGTLAPWDPPAYLVTSGPYSWIRHPMITAVVLILLGEAVLFNHLFILIWCLLFFIANHLYFIYREEPGLLKKYGEEYRDYKREVPRWTPRV